MNKFQGTKGKNVRSCIEKIMRRFSQWIKWVSRRKKARKSFKNIEELLRKKTWVVLRA